MSVGEAVDPLLRLHIEELNRFVRKTEQTWVTKPQNLLRISEHLCEWTRTILSRSFGRISDSDANELRACFESAATLIARFSCADGLDADDRKAICVFAEHVRGRVEFLPSSNERFAVAQ